MRLRVPVLLLLPTAAVAGLLVAAPAHAAEVPVVGRVTVAGLGPGDLVRASASGFPGGAEVAVDLVSPTTTVPLAKAAADMSGAVMLPASTRIPVATAPGTYRLTETGPGGVAASSPAFDILPPRATMPTTLMPGTPGGVPAARIRLVGLANSPDVTRTVTIDGTAVRSTWSADDGAFYDAGIGVNVPDTLPVGPHTVAFTQTGPTPYTATATIGIPAPRVSVSGPIAPTARIDIDVEDTGWNDLVDVTIVGAAKDRHIGSIAGSQWTRVAGTVDVSGLSTGAATLTVVSRHNGATATTTVTVDPATVRSPGGLGPGQRVASSDGTRELDMQTDGNLVQRSYGRYAEWSTRTQGHPGARLTVQSDGNVVIRDTAGRALWSTGTAGIGTSASFGLDVDGQPVVLAANGRKAWSSFTPFGGQYQDVLRAGGYLFTGQSVTANVTGGRGGAVYVTLGADGSLVVRADYVGVLWSARTAGHPNAYLTLQTDGNLVLRAPNGAALWANGVRGVAGATLAAQSDGNVVERDSRGRAVWSTGTRVA